MQDEPVVKHNLKGYVSFANAGPNTRSTQLFINLADNTFLDDQGFSPIGHVCKGLEVMQSLHPEKDQAKGPNQLQLQSKGNKYLEKHFPALSYIIMARIVTAEESGC